MGPRCRNNILSDVAKELEFSAHSMSTTADGYEERAKSKVDAINMLKKRDVWLEGEPGPRVDEEMEDARDLLGIIQRLCKAGRNKAKARIELADVGQRS
jgi:bloom syndrome protein